MRVLVTGANGFLGRHVCAALRDGGLDVRAMCQPGTSTDGMEDLGEIVEAELLDPEDLVDALEGCEAVVHLAAQVSEWGPYAWYERVNVLGTRSLADAAAATGAHRFVFVSSLAVHGVGDFDGAEQYDVDYSATLEDVSLVDRDDFRRMVEVAREGLQRMSFGDLILLADGFEPGVRTGIVPAGPAGPEPTGGLWADVTNVCDEAGKWSKCRNRRGNHAALFRGPASGDRGLRYAFCEPGDGACVEGYRSDAGATLSLRVKAWSPTWDGDGAVLAWVAGYRIDALVAADGREVRWRVLPPGSGPALVLRDRGAVGEWTRLVLQINDRRDEVRLIARRGDQVLDETTAHSPAARLDLSELWVGAAPGKVTSLTGLIDDVVLISWPVKY